MNFEDSITKNYLILSERRDAERSIGKNPAFKILKNELPAGDYSVILFGSRAEGTQRDKSDVDICVINKDGRKNVKFLNFELLFKHDVNPVYLSLREFRGMLNEKEHNLAHEIIKKHIILYGEEYFWNGVWKNGI